jgi:peptide/nickel transport system substrate-binding protein
MDGPVDHRSFGAQPIILEKLPDFGDGDIATATVTVRAGELYVSETGSVEAAPADVPATQMMVTFTLRNDIVWSDGEALTVADSVFGFQVACDPDTPTSKYNCERTSGYAGVNDYTVVWTGLPGYLPADYYDRFWTPLPEHVLGTQTPAEILNGDYGRNPLGWGAFAVDEWVSGQYISLKRNPHYWRSDFPQVDYLIYRFFSSPQQALDALLDGEVHVLPQDVVNETMLPDLLTLEAEGVLDVHFSSGTVWEHIDFDIQPTDGRLPFFAGRNVRRAVAYGTNRQKMVNEILYGQVEVLDSFIPSSHPFYPPPGELTEYAYDPVAARALLDSVGWRDEDNDGVREAHGVVYERATWDWSAGTYGPTETYTIPDNTPFEVTFQTTGATLRRQAGLQFQQDMAAIGISVTLKFMPSADLFMSAPDGPIWGRKFDVVEFAWLTGVEPPCDLYMAQNIPDEANGWSGQNVTGWVNNAYDEACSRGKGALTGREQHLYEAQRIFSEELPVLPLFTRLKIAVSDADLQGLQVDPTENSEFYNVEEWFLSSKSVVTALDGGTVASNDGRTTVAMASGVVSDTVNLTYTPWVVSDTVNLTYTPWVVAKKSGLADIGHAFELTAVYSDTGGEAQPTPGRTYTVTVTYADVEAETAKEETLALYWWDGSQWMKEPSSTVETTSNVVTAHPERFALWAVLGENRLDDFIYLPLVSGVPAATTSGAAMEPVPPEVHTGARGYRMM